MPGVGWASGVERLMMMIHKVKTVNPIAQLIVVDDYSKKYASILVNRLRKLNIKIRYDYKINVKKSLKKANESKLKFVILIGENEVNNNQYTVKNLSDGNQNLVSFDQMLNILKS